MLKAAGEISLISSTFVLLTVYYNLADGDFHTFSFFLLELGEPDCFTNVHVDMD